jgi:hypothetical protein
MIHCRGFRLQAEVHRATAFRLTTFAEAPTFAKAPAGTPAVKKPEATWYHRKTL